MMENQKGYKAILSELKRQHGVDVTARTMQSYVERLRRGDGPGTRAIRGSAAAPPALVPIGSSRPLKFLCINGASLRAVVHQGSREALL